MMAETKNTKAKKNYDFPSDWEIMEFGEFAEVTKGKYNPVENGNMKCLELEHFEQGTGAINGWTNSVEQKSIKNKFVKGQVLFGKLRPYLQKYWFTDFDGVCSSEIWVLNSISKKCTNEFLFRLVQTNKFIQVANVSSGSKMPRADWEYISNFPFPLPPLPEQKAIAQVLSTADAAINTTEKLIAQKELRKKWLMQNLLTGKKRLNLNLQDDRIYRIEKENNSENHENSINSDSDSGLRLKGFGGEWKEYKLSDLFDRVTRKNTEGNTTVVTISAQRGFVRQTDFFNKNIASEITDNYFLVDKGEFCYNKSYSNGYLWGATKRLNDFDKAVVTTLYICFGVKDEKKTNPVFFEQYFGANHLDKGLTKIAHEGGRAHGLLNVTPSDFFSLKVTVPNYEEQTAIAQVLQAADKEISLLRAKAVKLQEQKRGLMQQLLTGKKRLIIDNQMK
jgi:type I restriction enzyme S subunit